ncbi:MAG: hypothetical protein HC882_09895 [Acidobacteria bacterium]|nr:hypothetical protein [Acidobacteriota bacterium]
MPAIFRSEKGARVGLALAGGGPEGAIYEIGAVRALDEAVEGVDFTCLDTYVGVSAGAFIAACLANKLSPEYLCRAIVSHEPGEHPFLPEMFFTPALSEFAHRGMMVPSLLWQASGTTSGTLRTPASSSRSHASGARCRPASSTTSRFASTSRRSLRSAGARTIFASSNAG